MAVADVDLNEPDPEWREILSALHGGIGPTGSTPRGLLGEIFSADYRRAPCSNRPSSWPRSANPWFGRIAHTVSGESRAINGDEGIAHLHRLRACVDAVVIGVDTAIWDDPLLTVRYVDGKSPARIVIDPNGRLPRGARLLADDGINRIMIGLETAPAIPDCEQIRLPSVEGRIAPHHILAALSQRGFHRVLIEGGPKTVGAFLADGCIDRLHVIVAPLLIGSGRSSIELAPVERLAHAVRPPTRVYPLGSGEALFDMDLASHRVRHNGR